MIKNIIVEINKIKIKLSITTITKKNILQKTVLKLKKTKTTQKTSIGFTHIYSNNWY